jgi:hypothetical protein
MCEWAVRCPRLSPPTWQAGIRVAGRIAAARVVAVRLVLRRSQRQLIVNTEENTTRAIVPLLTNTHLERPMQGSTRGRPPLTQTATCKLKHGSPHLGARSSWTDGCDRGRMIVGAARGFGLVDPKEFDIVALLMWG